METSEAIYNRRSVRKFTNEKVSEEELHKLIAAGMMAPSAGNRQPWHFITVTDPKRLSQVGQVNPNAGMASRAPAGILVCGDTELEMHPGYWVQDCSAAVQNILLAAHDAGLGAVWTGIWPKTDRVEGFKKLFSIPSSIHPLAFLVIGRPDKDSTELDSPDRFLTERIREEHW